jgi:ankyrin repeat protein
LNEESNTALIAATRRRHTVHNDEADAKKDHLAVCRLLLDKGAKTNFGKNHQLLSFAARFGNLVLCQLLIDKGERFDIRDDKGLTPLMHALENHHIKVSRFLIQKGANVDAKYNCGETALMRRAKVDGLGGNIYARVDGWGICKMLVEEGAALDMTNKDGKTGIIYIYTCIIYIYIYIHIYYIHLYSCIIYIYIYIHVLYTYIYQHL